MGTKAVWSGKELAVLRRMDAEGESPEAISRALPGRTVIAVLAQRLRMGLAPIRKRKGDCKLLQVGEVIHIGGVPYVYRGRGRVEGAASMAFARDLRDGVGQEARQ